MVTSRDWSTHDQNLHHSLPKSGEVSFRGEVPGVLYTELSSSEEDPIEAVVKDTSDLVKLENCE